MTRRILHITYSCCGGNARTWSCTELPRDSYGRELQFNTRNEAAAYAMFHFGYDDNVLVHSKRDTDRPELFLASLDETHALTLAPYHP